MDRTAVKQDKHWSAVATRKAYPAGTFKPIDVKVSCGHQHALKREAIACGHGLTIVLGPPQKVTSPWNGEAVTCRHCGSDEFLDAGRSLDYYNWECAHCGASASTLTETGMSR